MKSSTFLSHNHFFPLSNLRNGDNKEVGDKFRLTVIPVYPIGVEWGCHEGSVQACQVHTRKNTALRIWHCHAEKGRLLDSPMLYT